MSVTTKKIVETNFEVTALIEGFEYEFRVKCENIGGESDWSEISEAIVPKSDQSPRAPAFREEIRDMTVKYHANATFVTKVTTQLFLKHYCAVFTFYRPLYVQTTSHSSEMFKRHPVRAYVVLFIQGMEFPHSLYKAIYMI